MSRTLNRIARCGFCSARVPAGLIEHMGAYADKQIMFVPFARALTVARPRLARCLQTSAAATGGSVNPEEIAFFSKLSSQWWDETGEFGFLHRMNPLRVQFIRDKLHEVALDERPDDFRAPGKNTVSLSDVLRDLNVLDVGCGGGLLSEVRAVSS